MKKAGGTCDVVALTWVLGALSGAAFGCTNARLYGDNEPNPTDRATIKGNLCTSDPAERKFPVKVLLLVDTSVADGNYIAQRGDSIERLVRTYAGPNYEYAMIRYSGPLRGTTCGFQNLTPDGFTKSLEEPIASVRCGDLSNPGRDLAGALSLANNVISGDILQTSQGKRSRSKYVVIVLANGPPTVRLDLQWCRSRNPRIDDVDCPMAYFANFCSGVEPPVVNCQRYQYTRVVREMRRFALDNGAQEFFFHVVYQRDPDDALAAMDDPVATDLYAELALHGGGTFYRFPDSQMCDVAAGDAAGCLFAPINLDSTESVFQRKQLIVSNRSALATGIGLLPDTDQDGLDDATEVAIGTDPLLVDTDGDNLSDRLEHLLTSVRLNPLIPATLTGTGADWPPECPLPGSPNPAAFPPDQDLDGDGLKDCEEILIRSDPTLFDSDADGIPDPLEFRYGSNLIAADILEDKDADGFANLDEYRFHLAPLAKDPTSARAYRYNLTNEEMTNVISFTQPFQVTGVYVTGASEASRDGRGTVYFEPAADPSAPVSAENPARLSWGDPLDLTPNGNNPGRGPDVLITGDGVYVLPSGGSNSEVEENNLSLIVEVLADQLPKDPARHDVILRRSLRFCLDFEVREIQLVATMPQLDSNQEGVNFIDVYLAEAPINNPTSFGVFRVATVTAVLPANKRLRYPQPDIELVSDDFLLFGD